MNMMNEVHIMEKAMKEIKALQNNRRFSAENDSYFRRNQVIVKTKKGVYHLMLHINLAEHSYDIVIQRGAFSRSREMGQKDFCNLKGSQ